MGVMYVLAEDRPSKGGTVYLMTMVDSQPILTVDRKLARRFDDLGNALQVKRLYRRALEDFTPRQVLL